LKGTIKNFLYNNNYGLGWRISGPLLPETRFSRNRSSRGGPQMGYGAFLLLWPSVPWDCLFEPIPPDPEGSNGNLCIQCSRINGSKAENRINAV